MGREDAVGLCRALLQAPQPRWAGRGGLTASEMSHLLPPSQKKEEQNED